MFTLEKSKAEEDPLNKLLQQYGPSVLEQYSSNVWPGYMFSGKLRPSYPLVCSILYIFCYDFCFFYKRKV